MPKARLTTITDTLSRRTIFAEMGLTLATPFLIVFLPLIAFSRRRPSDNAASTAGGLTYGQAA